MPNTLTNGRRQIETSQRFQVWKVVLSPSLFLIHSVRDATIDPSNTGAVYPTVDDAQNQGVVKLQTRTAIAMLHRAFTSPHTSGRVLRFLAASPLWSSISWVWTVLKTIPAIIRNHRQWSQRVASALCPPTATCMAPEKKQTKPQALIKLRIRGLLSLPCRSLYQYPSNSRLKHWGSVPKKKLTATAIG